MLDWKQMKFIYKTINHFVENSFFQKDFICPLVLGPHDPFYYFCIVSRCGVIEQSLFAVKRSFFHGERGELHLGVSMKMHKL